MYAIVGQDSVGLANIDDPTIVGWWMDSPDEPDNAQDKADGSCYDPPVAPATLVTEYDAYKAARSDAADLPRARAGRRLRRLGRARQQRAGRVGLRRRPATSSTSTSTRTTTVAATRTSMVTCGQFWLNAYGIDRHPPVVEP